MQKKIIITLFHIVKIAALQHFINASNDGKNSKIFIPRGQAILAIQDKIIK